MKPKTIIVRLIIEIVIFVAVFIAVDNLTWPSESTATAVQEAVNKKQLEPGCMVEVFGAVRSGSSMRSTLFVIRVAVVLLLCSDGWALWQARRKV